jgi:hypothetical protein
MNTKRGFANVLSLVLLAAFGIAATAMLVKTATDTNTKTDLRSRASEDTIVDARWEFKKDMSSWIGTGWQRLAVDPKAGVLIGQPSTSMVSTLIQTNFREMKAKETVWNAKQKRTAVIRFAVLPLATKMTPRPLPMERADADVKVIKNGQIVKGGTVAQVDTNTSKGSSMTVGSAVASMGRPLVARPSTTFSVSLIQSDTKKVYTAVPVQVGAGVADYRIALNALEDVSLRNLGFQFSSYATPVEIRIEEIRFEHVKSPTESVRDMSIQGVLSEDRRGEGKYLVQTSAGVIYAVNGMDKPCMKPLSLLLSKTVCVSGKVTDQMQKTLVKKDYPSIVVRDCRTDITAGNCPEPTSVVVEPTSTACIPMPACVNPASSTMPVCDLAPLPIGQRYCPMATPVACTPLPACAYNVDMPTDAQGGIQNKMLQVEKLCKIAATPPNGGAWCPREPVSSCKGQLDGTSCTNANCPQADCPKGKMCPMRACASALGTCSNSQCVVGGLKPTPLPAGCVYKQVQCVKAPCDPVVVCTKPPQTDATPVIRPGCREVEVQCFKAPCPKQMLCAETVTQ